MTAAGEILERLAALDAELGELPARLLGLLAETATVEREQTEAGGERAAVPSAFAPVPELPAPAGGAPGERMPPPEALPALAERPFAALPALEAPTLGAGGYSVPSRWGGEASGTVGERPFAALPALEAPTPAFAGAFPSLPAGPGEAAFPPFAEPAFGGERPAPGAFGALPLEAEAGLGRGGAGGGVGGGGDGETVALLERVVEQLDAIAQQLDRPAEGAAAAPVPEGNVRWSASWSADRDEDAYPASSPSVNVSTRAGNRGAGGYGFGSSWGQPKSDFYEPERRRPRP